jgi:serine/threonine protein kinase
MEKNSIFEGLIGLPPHSSSTIAVAINGDRKSSDIIKWALGKFVPEGTISFTLLYVRPKIVAVPTPMGNLISLSQVREDIAVAFKKEVEWQTTEKLDPYKRMFERKKVQVEIAQIESDDIVTAIAAEVHNSCINRLVIGASSRSIFSRGKSLSSRIAECAPCFCTVYAVSRGKLSSIRPADSSTVNSIRDESNSDTSSSSTNESQSFSSSSQTAWTDASSTSYTHMRSASLAEFQVVSNINKNLVHKRTASIETELLKHHRYYNSDESGLKTFRKSWESDRASASGSALGNSSGRQLNVNFELEKLRVELRHIQGMYAVAQSETIDASRKVTDLEKRQIDESSKLVEMNAKKAEAEKLVKEEREIYEAILSEAEYVKECVEKEAAQRKDAEFKANRETREKEKLESALVGSTQQYHKFNWDEIRVATSSFSDTLKIGMGAYGTVYKCFLHHTVAAVKVLHSKEAHKNKQFLRELEVLSKIRHPHLLILLGACPENGCLVYEYMENGSLEDRLFRKYNSPPIPWFDRFRIAYEIASALVFLHNTKPDPIIHRDLKPGNILLDRNLVSKIGDVGLSTILHSDTSPASTMYKDTGPVGTLSYIDPEYQRTGLISPKSDVYAFGMVVLQLLTGKPAIALAYVVETAIDEDNLLQILDPDAGEWPVAETKELALLGVSCSELRRRDRPDLTDQVLPALEKLKEMADKARDSASTALLPPPTHFICPILNDVMEDPCVAADGYTYDRNAIMKWMEEVSEISPMTNLPLPNKTLLPNYTLLSAILDWKSGKK